LDNSRRVAARRVEVLLVALGSEAISKQYGLDELPVTVVLDRSGKQVERFEGFTAEDALEAVVRQVL
jgi:thioredoxin-like negative regulator of GroEL